ncbi:uncharacterized protein LOC123211075 isoform X2 [Mangifera indica]|uniref:uncharacterized protein LOC123211075 isoform X2 n=1 Tax=Mangifera indica TaxID=29780 RepID=UPI001CFAA6D6|nr:uncharacterized protein LOC123211075 isoform X2 [Mangifera indica]
MVALTHNSLMYSENLTLPTFQVIVMNANMGCAECRQRVSQLTSKINGLKEYTVDVPNKQVIVKGDLGFHSKLRYRSPFHRNMKTGSIFCLSLQANLRRWRKRISRHFLPLSSSQLLG